MGGRRPNGTDQLARPLFGLGEHSRQVYSDDAQETDDEASQKPNRHHDGGIAAQEQVRMKELADNHVNPGRHGSGGHEDADEKDGFQRISGKRRQRIYKKSKETPQGIGGAGRPQSLVDCYTDLLKACPIKEARQEDIRLRQAQNSLYVGLLHEPDRTAVSREFGAGCKIEQSIEQRAGLTLKERSFSFLLNSVRHVGLAGLESGPEAGKPLRLLFQVDVDQEDALSGRIAETGEDCRMVAEVARKIDHLDVRVVAGNRNDALQR